MLTLNVSSSSFLCVQGYIARSSHVCFHPNTQGRSFWDAEGAKHSSSTIIYQSNTTVPAQAVSFLLFRNCPSECSSKQVLPPGGQVTPDCLWRAKFSCSQVGAVLEMLPQFHSQSQKSEFSPSSFSLERNHKLALVPPWWIYFVSWQVRSSIRI